MNVGHRCAQRPTYLTSDNSSKPHPGLPLEKRGRSKRKASRASLAPTVASYDARDNGMSTKTRSRLSGRAEGGS